jgi:hypothetical protein
MDVFNNKLAEVNALASDIGNEMELNSQATSAIEWTHRNSYVKKDISRLSKNLAQLQAALKDVETSLPQSPPKTILTNSIKTLVRTQQKNAAFTCVCNELIQLAYNFTDTGYFACIAEIHTVVALSRWPALIQFPLRTVALTKTEAQKMAAEINTLTPERTVTPDWILLLKKGYLLAEKPLPYSSLLWFLTRESRSICKDMSDAKLGAAIGDHLDHRVIFVQMAYKSEDWLKAVFGAYATREDCCNGFRKQTAGDFLDEFKDKFERTKRELCLICDCKDCRILAED